MVSIQTEDSVCVICLNAGGEELVRKNRDFSCECAIYFHSNCWEEFRQNGGVSCPYCRNNLVIVPNFSVCDAMIIVLFYIGIITSFVLFISGAAMLSPSEQNYNNIIHICIGFPSLWIFNVVSSFLSFRYQDTACGKIFKAYAVFFGSTYSCIIFIFLQVYLYSGKLNNHNVIFAGAISTTVTYYGIISYLSVKIFTRSIRIQPNF
jgi:uncharacterized Zn-finger protein